MEPYKPRAFRFIELCQFGKWRMKLYGIACQGELPRTELLVAAKKIAAIELTKFEPNDFYLGFIGAHDGRNAAFVFVDFWGNENELFHRVFLSRDDDEVANLSPAGNSDPSVCVWDLALQSFERAAWIKHVLLKADAPNFAGYLSERMNSDL
jgi:hypothetical protein